MVIEPTDGMLITQDVVLKPGVYYLPNGITVGADGVTVEGQGAFLTGLDKKGQGLTINRHKGVTVRGLRLREYFHGIYAHNCQDLTIEQCHITGTAEVAANTIFLDIWRSAEAAYGAAIFLWSVAGAKIRDNDLQHQQNGLLSYRCQQLEVESNTANYCSGAGFYLNGTSDSLFKRNFADFCCRYQPRAEGVGHMGADAAGFVIVNRSSRNIFRDNFARLSGDGFFLAGLAPGGTHASCDDNLFESNDGSYSPNIAFEATFSRGNVYRGNLADSCNYGFWLGFSKENMLEENRIWRNRQAGLAVENGFGMVVRRNDLRFNQHGILLWSKYVTAFARAVPENDTSRNWLIEDNQFQENSIGIRIAADQDHGVRDLPSSVPASPRPHSHVVRQNLFRGGRIAVELDGVEDMTLDQNQFEANLQAAVLQK